MRDLVREHLLEAAVRIRRRALGQDDDDAPAAAVTPSVYPDTHAGAARASGDDSGARRTRMSGPGRVEPDELHHARDPRARPGGEPVRGRRQPGLGLEDEARGLDREERRRESKSDEEGSSSNERRLLRADRPPFIDRLSAAGPKVRS